VTVFPEACATVDPENEQIALEYLTRIAGAFTAAVGAAATTLDSGPDARSFIAPA